MEKGDQFLLGEINAVVKGTADDVKALRLEMGVLANSISILSGRITTIEADRSAMKPEYVKFVNRVNAHMSDDATWKASYEGQSKMFGKYTSAIWAGIALFMVVAASFVTYSLGQAQMERRHRETIEAQQEARNTQQNDRSEQQGRRDARQDTRDAR